MRGNFGFIHEKIEIKILILFILRRLNSPVTFDVLTELTMCDDGISYFDYTDCVAELVKTEHVVVEDGKYSVTAKGIRNGGITENSLPFTVRMEAEKSTSEVRAANNRNSMIKTSHSINPGGGCTTKLALSDGVGDIISLEILAPNAHQAQALENGFRKNAEGIYHALLDTILDK